MVHKEGFSWDVHDVDEDLYLVAHVIQFKLYDTIHVSCKWCRVLTILQLEAINFVPSSSR